MASEPAFHRIRLGSLKMSNLNTYYARKIAGSANDRRLCALSLFGWIDRLSRSTLPKNQAEYLCMLKKFATTAHAASANNPQKDTRLSIRMPFFAGAAMVDCILLSTVKSLKTFDFLVRGDTYGQRFEEDIMDQINLGAWIDRSETTTGTVASQSAAMIHAVVGEARCAPPTEGEIMPHLWHWYAFPPSHAMDQLGVDGHPRMGDFMPPVRLNRRMWAGGNIEFRAPLHVGEPLRRRTTISNIKERTGEAGDIVIVSLDLEIHGAQGLAVIERQDIVYLEIPDTFTPPKRVATPAHFDEERKIDLTTALLFRYSAITFNAHRIHYDLPYTRDVEHYPDLVVHGPLQAQLLMNAATEQRGTAPKMFAYRGVHPLFAQDDMTLCTVKKSQAEWALSANTQGGYQTMQANAMWEI